MAREAGSGTSGRSATGGGGGGGGGGGIGVGPQAVGIEGIDALLGTDHMLMAESEPRGKKYKETPAMHAVRMRITTGGRLVYKPDLKLCKWVVTVPTNAEEKAHPGTGHIIYMSNQRFADAHLQAVAERIKANQMLGYHPFPEVDKWVLVMPDAETEAKYEGAAKAIEMQHMIAALLAAHAARNKAGTAAADGGGGGDGGGGAAAAAAAGSGSTQPAAAKKKKNQTKQV